MTTYFTEAQLQDAKFADLAGIYNIIAKDLGQNELKKFRDKSTGVARILKIQDEHKAAHPAPKPIKTTKRQIVEKNLTDEGAKKTESVTLEWVGETPKGETTNAYIYEAINAELLSDREEVVSFVISKYDRPSGQEMTRRLAMRRINMANKKGLLVFK